MTDYIQKGGGNDHYTVLANQIANSVDGYRAVRQSALGYRAMETADEGLSLVRPDGTFSYVNSAFAQLFGYQPDELVDEQWTILYHDQEAHRLEHDILPAVTETGYWSGETVRLTKASERLVTDHRLAHTEEDGIICTAKDVTAERTTSIEQTPGFDLLLASLEEDAFYTLDHDGYVTRWTAGGGAPPRIPSIGDYRRAYVDVFLLPGSGTGPP